MYLDLHLLKFIKTNEGNEGEILVNGNLVLPETGVLFSGLYAR